MTALSPSPTRRPSAANPGEREIVKTNGVGPAGDLTILGNGFFVVRDPETNQFYATQFGRFNLNAYGYLVTDTGARVQGRIDGTLSATGDIRINGGEAAQGFAHDSTMLCYSVDSWGKIIVYYADGTSVLRGQILLQNYRDLEALISEGHQLFSNLPAAGPLPALTPPGCNGLGKIHSGLSEFAHEN